MNSLIKDISTARKRLIKKAQTKGLCENFGQTEVHILNVKHIDAADYNQDMMDKREMLNSFDQWCQNYTGGKG